MAALTDADLYNARDGDPGRVVGGVARGSHGAAVIRSAGVACAVFPNEPERAVYNNALLERDRAPGRRAEALKAMEAAYASASINHFAGCRRRDFSAASIRAPSTCWSHAC